MKNVEIIDRADFARYIGEPYTGDEYGDVYYGNYDDDASEESNIQFSNRELEHTFGCIDDNWFSEWDYRRHFHMPFFYTESDGNSESEIRIMSADEFYDLLLLMKEEAKSGHEKYRYI